MKRLTMVKVWACAPATQNRDGEIHTAYRNPKAFYANIQNDRNAVDAAAHGETLDQIIKLRTDTLPPVEVSHAIYLTKPEPMGTAEIDGASYDDYGPRGNTWCRASPRRQSAYPRCETPLSLLPGL